MNAYKDFGVQKVIVGLDVGTSGVAVASATITDAGVVEIIGYGKVNYPSAEVINDGVIANVANAKQAIRQAIDEMELMAPCGDITEVYVGLTGEHVKGCHSCGIGEVQSTEVTDEDISQVLDPAQVAPIETHGCRILHITPQSYRVDNQGGIKEPRGMLGNKLEAKVHVVACDEKIARNLEQCIKSCRLKVRDIALNTIAASNAVLSQEEKDLGACLIDIGAGTADIAVFAHGAVQHVEMMPLGGREVTSDIAYGLQLTRTVAEKLKISHGCALQQLVAENDILSIKVDGKTLDISRHFMAKISEARYRELFELTHASLDANGYMDGVINSIILTGGAVCMEGIEALAEEVFHKQIRIGTTINARGLDKVVNDPAYSTAVGLLMQGIDDHLPNFNQKPISALRSLWNWLHQYL